jgi:glutathione S-transferase
LIEVHDRSELETWLAGGPPARAASSVMLVRGDGPPVREFLPNALDAAKESAGRVVVWVRDPAQLAGGPVGEAFAKSDDILAVVLAADGSVGGWVTGDRIGVADAAFAFENAEMIHA